MAGAGKHRARKERRNGNGKDSPESPETGESPSTNSPPEQSSPQTRFDGASDPEGARQAMNPSNNGNGNGNGVIAVRASKNLDLGLYGSYLLHGVS